MQVLVVLSACISPVVLWPVLWRVVRNSSVDGFTAASAGMALVTYAGWLGLATHTGSLLVITTGISTASSAVLFIAVVHGQRTPAWAATGMATLAIAAALVAAVLPESAVAVLLVVGGMFWVRLIGDIRRSDAASAMSVWTLVLYLAGNVAWLVESARSDSWQVFALVAAMMMLMAAALAVTVQAHRRPPVAPVA